MASSDGAILLATARWSDEQNYLHEIVKRSDLPTIARIVKGHYLSLGVPSLPNPSLSSTILLASAGRRVLIAAQCLKFKDNRRTVNLGPKLAIPDNFDGYFEILNEDGKAVRCIESVSELTRKFPNSCLVRENIKAFISRSDSIESITERSRTILTGELLTLVGEVSGVVRNRGHARFLRCFDSRGENVFLPIESRGKFSTIAKEDNISGVHSIKNLLNKRLPLMVRMVSGKPPGGLKVGQQFCYEMRLLATLEEEMLVALPLLKDTAVALIPPTASLKLQLPLNANSIRQSKEFLRMHDRCMQKLSDVADMIHVYDANFSKTLRFDGQQWRFPIVSLPSRSNSDLLSVQMKSLVISEEEDPDDGEIPEEYDEIDQIYDYVRGFAPLPKNIRKSFDVINGNVNESNHRQTDSNRNVYNRISSHKKKSTSPVSSKPEPPPVETIPSRKLVQNNQQSLKNKNESRESLSPLIEVPDKVSHISQDPENHTVTICVTSSPLTTPKPVPLLRKTISHDETPAKSRMFRQRSAIPLRGGQYKNHNQVPILSPAESKQSLTPSPLFNIRYKSMTNLLAADSDTLGSSQSGGRCSGGSAGSAAVRNPPHYMRQISAPISMYRPQSLTDLFWDARSGKPPPKIQLHPTVVADVIPPPRNHSRSSKTDSKRRKNTGSKNGTGSSKRHTIFYHL